MTTGVIHCLYIGITVSNGVHQGGVLSSFIFAVYLDSLLKKFSLSGVKLAHRGMDKVH